MNLSSYEYLKLVREDRVLNVTFNFRNDQLNPITSKVEAELSRLFIEVARDPDTNVVVLTGGGRAFSAGGDLDDMQHLVDHPGEFDSHAAKQLIFAMLDCPKVVIAKVNGHAIGLGATIALFCDVIFAASHAKIGDPHVKVGFAAGDGGAVIWPQLIGYARAKELLLTGDLLTADEAARMGLINHSVPADELDAKVSAFAQRLASGATRAIQYTKITMNLGLKQLAHSMMDASIAYEHLTNYTRDHREAVAAFREKRPPVFIGE